MGRLFKKGSRDKIKKKLYRQIETRFTLSNQNEFKREHNKFCEWFINNIQLAKKSEQASYGHAAKVLDIVLKVCFYYCRLPDEKTATKIIPWLNTPIDTALLSDIKKRFQTDELAKTQSIKHIDREKYCLLQKFVRADIKKSLDERLKPVMYDDIKWRKLHKKPL